MRILLVEDEIRMAQALCEILRQEQYEVDHYADGTDGLAAIESGLFDLIILDVMLPGLNGYEIAKRTRAKGIMTPILMLTAKAELDDKVTGLDCGADDYLTKPFMTKELLSRVIVENSGLVNIQYENERMGLLVGQLLELARTENIVPQTECVNFSRIASGEMLPFESVVYEKGLTLHADICDGIFVDGNSTQLKQLVSILLDNAIWHSTEDGNIRLLLCREHGHVRLSVINKGDEIPKEHREQIFERFYRVDAARTGRTDITVSDLPLPRQLQSRIKDISA